MESPQIRPGRVSAGDDPIPRVIARFPNAAQGNAVIQLLVSLGVPSDRLGVVPPDRMEGGQGMILSIGCPDASLLPRVEDACRTQGAEVRRTRS